MPSSIIMPRGIIKPPGLVLDLPMQGEQLSGLELITDGQDMGDAAWIDVGGTPPTNELVASHDGQTNCRHVVTDAAWEGVANTPLFTTVTGQKYRGTVKLKVISGEASIRTQQGDGSGTDYSVYNLTPASWTTYTFDYIETSGGSSAQFWVDGGDLAASEYYFDEASIQRIYTADVSGLGYHGTVNGPTVAQGLHGGCYSFTTDDFIDLGNPSSLQITGDLTILALFKTDTKGKRVMSKDNEVDRCYFLKLDATTGRPHFGIFTGNALKDHKATTTDCSDDIWHWAAGVNDGTNIIVYVDGIKEGSTANGGAIDNDAADAIIGATKVGTEHWEGEINIVKIFNRALNEAQIQYEMYRSAPLKPVMNGGVLWPN